MSTLNLVLFGPPGAGKGTQSDKIIEKYGLTHLSTGDLFRKHFKEHSDLGKLAQKYMDQGMLVPDQVVIDMVEDKLKEENHSRGNIFDGFPRTIDQARALDNMLEELGQSITQTILLEVPEQELIKRILNRGISSGRNDDQDEEKIYTRIRVYEEETLPVANYYQEQGKLFRIKGVGSVDDIFDNICNTINHQ